MRFARCFLARRRNSQITTMKIKAHPSAIRRISHHSSPRLLTITVGSLRPVIEGSGEAVPAGGVCTNSERHTPNPGITFDALAQFAATHAPARRTEVELAHARQLFGPAPEQLEHVVSHAWHAFEVVSKNWLLVHVGRQRPLVSTGNLAGQDKH